MKTIVSGKLQYLQAESIGVSHGFTTRLGGVSQGALSSLNLGCHRGDAPGNVEKNYEILGQALGFSLEDLVLTSQIHSDIVRTVKRADAGKGTDHRAYPRCDGLVTNDPGVTLMVFTADCTPILFWDPATGAVGAAHAGWRGTAAGIASRVVETMARSFGSRPEDIRAAIGPNIGPCCFETDRDVPEAMLEALGDAARPWISRTGDKYHVDLKEINAAFLRRSGVREIEISDACTMCQCDRFWSHRATGGVRGSQGALIRCEGRKA